MQRRPSTAPFPQPDAVTLAAATWLACGGVLFGLTPLPLHDPTLGWSPAFWLLAAPAVLLLAKRWFGGNTERRTHAAFDTAGRTVGRSTVLRAPNRQARRGLRHASRPPASSTPTRRSLRR